MVREGPETGFSRSRSSSHWIASDSVASVTCLVVWLTRLMRLLVARIFGSLTTTAIQVSAFPPLATDVEAAGGEFVEGPDVVDGNMVSARGWGDLAEWSRAFMAVLDRAVVVS